MIDSPSGENAIGKLNCGAMSTDQIFLPVLSSNNFMLLPGTKVATSFPLGETANSEAQVPQADELSELYDHWANKVS